MASITKPQSDKGKRADNRADGVLFVCTGNICRSPSAEAILRKMTGGKVLTDSAGISNYHRGEKPDARAAAALERCGYDASGIRARQVCPDDFYRFAVIYAMDSGHFAALRRMSPGDATAKVEMFADADIPDPYYTGGFGGMMALLEDGCRRIASRFLPDGKDSDDGDDGKDGLQ